MTATSTLMIGQTIATNDDDIQQIAEQIAQSTRPVWDDLGRRSQARVPFPELVEFHGLTDDGQSLTGESFHVVGKNLAPLGFDFYHREPIPHRFALVTLPLGTQTVTFQVKVTWCRFLKPTWYDSGGRFVKILKLEQGESTAI